MHSFRYALVLGLLSLVSLRPVKADTMDYKTNILDPLTTNASVNTHIETTDAFSATFDACQANELPGGNTGSGCFAIFNRSGTTWTSLTLTVPNSPALGAQSVACNTDTNSLAYSSSSCGYSAATGTYTLLFDNGAFPSGTSNTLFIVETGIPYMDFPTFGVVAGTTATTPEPGSALLLGTGLAGLALLTRRQSRRPGRYGA